MKSKLLAIFCFAVLIAPAVVFGAPGDQNTDSYWWFFIPEFRQLIGIPGVDLNNGGFEGQTFGTYINALYRLSISLAALLAVIKIVAAGAKYILTDIVPGKEEAKKDIQGAIVGLLVIIAAVVILNTVNTDLTKNELMISNIDIDSQATFDKILAAQLAAQEAAQRVCDETELPNKCATLVCESLVGLNRFELREGENETSACLRTCREDYRGAYISHNIGDVVIGSAGVSIDSGWGAATCTYDPAKATTCDPNNSWNCCEDIKNGEWYPLVNKCDVASEPLQRINCSMFANCDVAKKTCIDSGNTIIKSPSGVDIFLDNGSYILCTNNEADLEYTSAQNTINSVISAPFSPITTISLTDEEISDLGYNLDIDLNREDVRGIIELPLTNVLITTGEPATALISERTIAAINEIAQSVTTCPSGNVTYSVTNNFISNAESVVKFVCLN